MHDGIELEARGLPTVVIVTEAFRHEAEVQRAALGMTDLEPAVIAHPLSTIGAAAIDERAAAAAGQARCILTGG